ncbi:MAG: hypothetical protein QW331_01590, partial [Candidatus Woesearchaeota archaeon]
WHAKDAAGNFNLAGPYNFTVTKAPIMINLTLNGVSSNLTIEWLSSLTAKAITDHGTVTLTRNGTNVSNPEAIVLPPGIHSYFATNPGNENYSESSSPTYFVNVVDTTSPDSVSNLVALMVTTDSITWQWNNPSNADFSHVEVYLNDTAVLNTSTNSYTISNLTSSTDYKLSLRTVDIRGNVNPDFIKIVTTTSNNQQSQQQENTQQQNLQLFDYNDYEGSISGISKNKKEKIKVVEETNKEIQDNKEIQEEKVEGAEVVEEEIVAPSASDDKTLSQQAVLQQQNKENDLLTTAAILEIGKMFTQRVSSWPALVIMAIIAGLGTIKIFLKNKESPLKNWKPEHKE